MCLDGGSSLDWECGWWSCRGDSIVVVVLNGLLRRTASLNWTGTGRRQDIGCIRRRFRRTLKGQVGR